MSGACRLAAVSVLTHDDVVAQIFRGALDTPGLPVLRGRMVAGNERRAAMTSSPFRVFLMTTLGLAGSLAFAFAGERQLTHAAHGHVLTNVNVWSPDAQWIVYDVRTVDSIFDGKRIEEVNVTTGETRVLFEAKNGASCGVATYHPLEPKVVFIHGPERPTLDWSYGPSRRRGAMVDTRSPGRITPLDAMNYAPPFVPGALRGGSHVHVFSPDGAMISATYEDEVLARLGHTADETGRDLNQRTVEAMFLLPSGEGVRVARAHPRNHDGNYFSVVVARTVNRPRPGSDEIGRAYEEGWVVGSKRERALAFLGNVVALDGREWAEVFLAELPSDLTLAGDGPLEGTSTRRPAPPRGVVQRRLTFTSERKFPGVVTAPRHWLRASADGSRIAFLMKDDNGVVQLFTVAPTGGSFRQVTQNPSGIESAFTWNPDGRSIAHTMDGRVCVTEMESGKTQMLTETTRHPLLPLACVFSPDGRQIAFMRQVADEVGSFSQIFTVDVPTP